MVKLRNARYCNIKLLLLFLVVYGHWIEPRIWSDAGLMAQYRGIYFLHMPLFAFLSGLFLQNGDGCLRQLKRVLPLYILTQSIAVFLGAGVKISTPFWHLWYLLSLSCWLGLGWLWFRLGGRRKWATLVGAVALGCLAGFVPWVGRPWSVSRTVVFFPCFFLGLICDPGTDWQRFRLPSLAGLAAAVLLAARSPIGPVFLYHAAPYSRPQEAWLRLVCYLIAFLLGLFVLAWCPARRFPFTRAGADTMPAYLLHGPIVAVLRQWSIPWVPLAAAFLLYVLYKALQWHCAPCGIIPGERSGSHGRISSHL